VARGRGEDEALRVISRGPCVGLGLAIQFRVSREDLQDLRGTHTHVGHGYGTVPLIAGGEDNGGDGGRSSVSRETLNGHCFT
jgi:hypothetical protein